MIDSIIIILCVLLYWKFFYFHKRKNKTAQFYLLVPGAIATFAGLYVYFFQKIIIPRNVWILFGITVIYNTVAFFNIFLAIRKQHKITPKIDYTLSWFDRTFGKVPTYVAVVLSYPTLFLIVIGTYWLLGYNYIYLWILVLIAWTLSQIRLIRNYVLR